MSRDKWLYLQYLYSGGVLLRTSTAQNDSPATIIDVLRLHAESQPNEIAYRFLSHRDEPPASITYRELNRQMRQIAAKLLKVAAPGDRAILLHPSGLDFIAAFLGCLAARVVAVPLFGAHERHRSNVRLQSVFADSQPSVVLTAGPASETVHSSICSGASQTITWVDTTGISGDGTPIQSLPAPAGEDIAFLQYTSGSTSSPKGVILTHANILHNQGMIQEAFGTKQESVIVSWLPLYHDMGLIGNVLQPLYAGATSVLMHPLAFLQDPVCWLQAISNYRATISGGPNFGYELCIRRIPVENRKGLDLSTWQVAFNGAEPVRADTMRRFAAEFADCGFQHSVFQPCYGLAEATLLVSGARGRRDVLELSVDADRLLRNQIIPDKNKKSKTLVACGNPSSNLDIRIVSPENHRECASDQIGEIWVKGPSVGRGYWNRKKESEETFQAWIAVNNEGPFLRTGDLGFIRKGQIFVTGRIKDLLIIRGQNHYPQDIELTVERSHAMLHAGRGAAFSVEVAGEEQLVVVQEVASRKADEWEQAIRQISQNLAQVHELAAHAIILVRKGTIPRTSSNKIQRQACKSAFLGHKLHVVKEWREGKPSKARQLTPAEPSSAISARKAAAEWLVAEISRRHGAKPTQTLLRTPITAFGMDSLRAIELAHKMRADFGLEFSVGDLLGDVSIMELVDRAKPIVHSQLSDPIRLTTNDTHLMSHGQRALWMIQQMEPDNAAYNIARAARIRSSIHIDALRRSLQVLVSLHPSLRTTFSTVDGQPVQRVHPTGIMFFKNVDAQSWTKTQLEQELMAQSRRPFDLSSGPLLRVHLYSQSARDHVLHLCMHHIVSDFWSVTLLVEQLGKLYQMYVKNSEPELAPPQCSYVDFVVWQEEQLLKAGEQFWNYWKQELSIDPDPLHLPSDKPRPPIQTFHGSSLPFALDRAGSKALRELGAARQATLFMTLLAAFQAFLHRLTGRPQIITGSPSACRPQPELAGVIGYFTNPLPLRADFGQNPSFNELLGQVRNRVLGGVMHDLYPFPLMAEKSGVSRDLSSSPIFQTMFVFQGSWSEQPSEGVRLALGAPGTKTKLGGMLTELIPLQEQFSPFDLMLNLGESPQGVSGTWQFNTDLFERSTIMRWSESFKVLLQAVVEHPDDPICRLPLLSRTEQKMLEDFNRTELKYEHLCLHQAIEQQAQRTPAQVAIAHGETRLTYAQLNEQANQIGRYLRRFGIKQGDVIGICMPRSVEMVAAMLGIWKAGAAYVPLDAQYPGERLRFMLQDSAAKVVLTHESLRQKAEGSSAVALCLDGQKKEILREPTAPLEGPCSSGQIAYVIYTSGSTGTPKGVMLTHANAMSFATWAGEAFSREELSAVLATTSICFDLSIFELWATLSNGGTVVLANDLLDWWETLRDGRMNTQVRLINTVPSVISRLIQEGPLPASVMTVNLAGEALNESLVSQVYQAGIVKRVNNLYGPTETTTYSTWTTVSLGRPVTIGKGTGNTRLYVLDTELELAPIGVIAELYIAGEGLGCGYWNRPGLTAERFLPNPYSQKPGERMYRTGDMVRWREDGQIEYKGRSDQQVKVRGFRVELGEIEAALSKCELVRENAVALKDAAGSKILIAYIEPHAKKLPSDALLRQYLEQRLPPYMMPSQFVIVKSLPKTPNGKVDRSALPEPQHIERGTQAPRNEVEAMTAAILAEVLNLQQVGVQESFFELGGHSLSATQVLSRIRQAFHVELPLRSIFEHHNVAALAKLIEGAARSQAPPFQQVSREEPLPLSFAQENIWFHSKIETDPSLYNIAVALKLKGQLNLEALQTSLGKIVSRHEILRTRFPEVNGAVLQQIAPAVETHLPVLETSAGELTGMLQQRAREAFNLRSGPMVRFFLLRLNHQEHILLAVLHHMVCDGWSLGVMVRELSVLYSGFSAGTAPSLPALPLQYADFAVWQRAWLQGEVLRQHLEYWKERLAGLEPLELPTDWSHPQNPVAGATQRVLMPRELTGQLRIFSRQQGVTLFMTLLTGLKVLLHRYTGRSDFSVGTPIANRNRAEIEPLIGCFVNSLVLRTLFSPNDSVADLLMQVREVSLQAYAHQDLPFEKLVAEMTPGRDSKVSPLFQVLFVMQNAPLALDSWGEITVEPIVLDTATAKFDLTLALREIGGALEVVLEYREQMFSRERIQRLLGHYQTLLEGIIADQQASISRIEILNRVETEQLLLDGTRSWQEVAESKWVLDLFQEQSGLQPQAMGSVQPRIYILDPQLNLVSRGIAGELYIGGLLEQEPLRKPDLNPERLLVDPFSSAPGTKMYGTGKPARWSSAGKLELSEPKEHNMKIVEDSSAKLEEEPIGPDANPMTLTEQMIAAAWSRVLGVKNIQREDNFFDLGGHSLVILRVFAQLEMLVGFEIPVRTIFEFPVLKNLAVCIDSLISQSKPSRMRPIVRQPRNQQLLLSSQQERLWFLDRYAATGTAYNLSAAVRLRGNLDKDALRRSFQQIVRRHEALRTSFVQIGARPRLQIHADMDFQVPEHDLRKRKDTLSLEERLNREIAEESARPFALHEPGLLRAKLLRTGDDEYALLVTVHHIVFDGWSVGVLVRELTELYAAYHQGKSSPLTELDIQYADYAAWQRELQEQGRLKEGLEYWKKQLHDLPSLELPTDRPRPALQSFNGTIENWNPPTELAPALKHLSREQGVTLYMTLLAALNILLARYTGQEDIVVGSPVANRIQPVLEPLIGFFANTVVQRVNVTGNPGVSELLARTRDVCLGSYAYQSVPFESLVDELEPQRDLSSNPLFQIAIALQNAPIAAIRIPGVEVSLLPSPGTGSKFDVTWFIEEDGEGLHASIEYNTDLFERETIRRLIAHYGRVLLEMTRNSNQSVSSLPFLSDPERLLLVADHNQTTTPLLQACFHEVFEQQAERIPQSLAVDFNGRTLSYSSLNQRANQLANYLIGLGVAPEKRVGIYVSRSEGLIIALLGVLKAGGVCVLLDQNESPHRLIAALEITQPHVLLTERELLTKAQECTGVVVDLDEKREELSRQSAGNPLRFILPENSAIVAFNSDDSAVLISHRSLTTMTQWAKSVFSSEDLGGVLASAATGSELAMLEIFAPLSVGGSLIRAENAFAATANQAGRITMMSGAPSAIRELLRRNLLPESLRTINLAGEPIPAELVRRILKNTGVERVLQISARPEAGVGCACIALSRKDNFNAIPIGKPVANTQIYVLGREMEPVPEGAIGELYLGGAGLSRGYLNQPAITATHFVPNPFSTTEGDRLFSTGEMALRLADGNLQLLGRPSDQPRVRRRNVALHDIESSLLLETEVVDAVVVAQDDPPHTKLIAYVIPQNKPSYPSPDWERQWREALRAALKRRLPEAMVPSEWILIDALPLTSDGKLNRRALPGVGRAVEAPTKAGLQLSNTEQTITNIWKQILKISEVGLDDNFFDVGGKSLLIPDVHLALENAVGRSIQVVDLFQYPTIRSLAEHIDAQETKEVPVISGTPIAEPAAALQKGAEADEDPVTEPVVAAAQIDGSAKGFAVIGMAGRFPGARNVDEFWQNLTSGAESIIDVSDEELREAGIAEAIFSSPSYVKRAAIVDDVEFFDAKFFAMSPREAEMMDPQQRLFLECAWEALETAGYPPGTCKHRIGVYAGSGAPTYMLNLMSDHRALGTSDATPIFFANSVDFLATRVSYKLNLNGPSVTVQTACSTALVALHMACRALLNNECDIALAGGITIRTPQKMGDSFVEGGIVSPDGHCRPFDEKADGTVRANGAGLVAIKRLGDALRDRDHIHAIIRGTAVNNDGARKVGYAAPSVDGQRDVICAALADGSIRPETIGYVEAHGTGTTLGDPIEVAALTQAFRSGTEKKAFCALGSVKSNVGHLDSAAGIAGMIKTVLVLEHKLIPPSINYERPNPKIDFDNSPFYVNTKLTEWKNGEMPRRAGVSSFGIGGTNVHAVLEEAPATKSGVQTRPYQILLLSAKTSTALEAATANLARYLRSHADTNIADVSYTLQVGREEFAHRRAIVCQGVAGALDALNTLDLKRVITGFNEPQKRPVVFMFPGQGAQYSNMALGLYENEKVFRQEVDHCAALLKSHLGFDLRDVIYPKGDKAESERSAARLMETEVTQPALFVVEYALAKLWIKWGIHPHAMIGHSIGEYVAACLAGVFSLEEALALVALRGKLMQSLPRGSMLVVPLPEKEILPLLNGRISLAAVNSPDFCVVSGPTEQLYKLEQSLAGRNLACRKLRTSHAFHSAMMDPILDRFAIACSMIRFETPRLRFISNLTGTWITPAEAVSPEYWTRHLRETVRFADGLRELVKDSEWVLLEVGPGRSLSSLARWNPHRAKGQVVLHSVRHPEESVHDEAFLLSAAGRLWLAGVQLDWTGFYENERRFRVPLPTYPFERQRYWIDPPKREASPAAIARLKKSSNITDWFYLPSWKSAPFFTDGREYNIARPWLIFADQLGFAAPLKEQLRQRGIEVWTAVPGFEYVQAEDSFMLRVQEAEDYKLLFQQLQERAKLPAKIIYLWTLADAHKFPASQVDLNSSFFVPLFIAQALGALDDIPTVEMVLVSNYLYDVTREDIVQPLRATLLGPCRVIPQEYPLITCRNIDVDFSTEETDIKEMASSLAEEVASESTDSVVAYRNGRRWIQGFDQVPVAASADSMTLRHKGHYLITGGLGGIGLAIAESLAENEQAKLVLIGRSALPDREFWEAWLQTHPEQDSISTRIRKLLKMEEKGAEVLVRSADVTQEDQMREVIFEAQERFGALHGVIHAAGLPGGGVIQLKTHEMAEAVLAPKVQGTMVLTSLLSNVRLDFFVACSSRTSILGSFGQVDYCAANAFLDLFAPYVRQTEHMPFVSVNWDGWSDVGMLVDSATQFSANKTLPGGVVEELSHPLLDTRISESAERWTYSSQVSPLTHWVLDEHRIAGNPVIPGTAYLEMARAAVEPFANGRDTEIQDVFFLSPLALREGESAELKTVIEERGEGYSFHILSKSDEQGRDEWNEYARGNIKFVAPGEKKRRDLDAIAANCSVRRVTVTDDSKRDEDLGPRWQSFRHAYVGENELLAFLELPEEFVSDFAHMKIHPALLDRALECGKEYLVTEGIYLPIGYRRLVIKAPLERRICAHLRLTTDGEKRETVSCDVTVFNQQGEELLEIEAFSQKRVNDIAGQIKAAASRQYRRNDDTTARASISEHRDPVSDLYAEELQQGITPSEGVQALRRVLRLKSEAQVVVSTKDLQASIREARSSKLVTGLLDKAARTTPTWARHPRPEIETVYAEPHSENEQRIAQIWQEVLGIDKVGVHDNFFNLGGDSVQAIQIVAKINEQGWQLTAQQLFQHQTVQELAAIADGSMAVQPEREETAEKNPTAPVVTFQQPEAVQVTPSDLPLVDLDEQEVAKLASILEETDSPFNPGKCSPVSSNGNAGVHTGDEMPAKIEGALREHQSVLEVLVTESPESADGISAYVVLKPDSDLVERPMEFSLFYFADSNSAANTDKYRLYLEGAKFADRHGFSSVWTPERHFHQKGGLYPNPAVLSSALAVLTEHVHLRSGSVVMPLHNPLRVAEEWSVVDNLSHGRIGLSFASGWVANDFAFFPERYANKRAEMFRGIAEVQRLWRGETILTRDGAGKMVELAIFPRPIQPELPVWLTCSGAPEMFVKSGELGFNVLTSLQEQSFEDVARNLKAYREARLSAGHNPSSGHVTMMLHTFLGENSESVIQKVREPLLSYLRSHIALIKTSAHSMNIDDNFKQEGVEESLANFALERYRRTASLIGTPESCHAMIQRLKSIGVSEVACLVDFGVDVESVLAGLQYLNALKELCLQTRGFETKQRATTALLNFLQQRLPSSMIPKSLALVSQLPRREASVLHLPAAAPH